jgi:exonuclease SbcD
MRILHTSDLHLGGTWFGRKRDDDERRVLGEILERCDQHGVDLLLVTGDVFSDRSRGELASVARRFFQQLAPAMRRGMRLMLLPGNHDSLAFFRLLHYVCEEWLGKLDTPPIIADLPGIYDVPGAELQVIA